MPKIAATTPETPPVAACYFCPRAPDGPNIKPRMKQIVVDTELGQFDVLVLWKVEVRYEATDSSVTSRQQLLAQGPTCGEHGAEQVSESRRQAHSH